MTEKILQLRIEEKIRAIDAFAEEIPGVVIIHDLKDFSVKYMSPRGQRDLGVTLEELVRIGPEYYNRYFNTAEEKDNIEKMGEFLERNSDDVIALFQQVRRSPEHEWTWYATSIRIFMRDDAGKPILTIAVAIPIDPKNHISTKVVRVVEENNFVRDNLEKFSSLTKREKQVLKCMSLGKTAAEVSKELHISVATAETHRKNIKRKLDINSSFDLSMYGRAFDLI